MKIFDSRKSIVMASIGVLFATLALVSCEKREESLLNDIAKYSKTVVFTEQQVQTRATAYTNYNTQMPDADYVLRAEESTDSMFLSAYVTDLESEQLITRATEATLSTLNQFYVLAYNANGELNGDLSKSVVPANDEKTAWHYTPEINWSQLGDNEVQFYGYANVIADNASQVSDSKFKLTIPENPDNQTDIIVAKAARTYRSNNTEQVPLQFNHILAGVRFVVGDKEYREEKDESGNITKKEAVNGYIKSIKLKNVVSSAVYDIQNEKWSEFNQTTTPDIVAADGLTSNPAKGNQVGSTLMLIPQNLKKSLTDETLNIKVEIVFHAEGGDRTLVASLSGSWDAGRMYTYKISNHKIDLLSFTSQPEVQDAHYVICPVEISLKSGLDLADLRIMASDGACIEMREELTPYEQLGYWIDNEEYKRLKNTNFKTESDKENIKERVTDGAITWDNINADTKKTVYLFIPENISNQDRTITLTLTGDTDNGGIANEKKLYIKQFCPTSTGCERIEEVDLVPWGPYWTIKGNDDSKVVQYKPNIRRIEDVINYLIVGIYGLNEDNWPKGVTFVYDSEWWSFGQKNVLQYVEIDYSYYLQFAQDERDNGHLNTTQIFAGNLNAGSANMDELLNLQNTLEQYGFSLPDGVEVIQGDVDNSAFVVAVKKNKYKLNVISGNDGNVLEFIIPSENINWYLPSISEIGGENGDGANSILTVKNEPNESELSGTYWSSTISTGNLSMDYSKAFTWPNGPAGDYIRTDRLSLRAVRAVTDGSTFQNASN